MPPVPLGIFAYKRTDGFQPEVRCVNFILEPDKSGASPDNYMRIQRPGLTEFATIPSPVRGVYQQDGVLSGLGFAAGDEDLYSFTEGSFTLIGPIGAGGRAPFAANYEKLFLLSGVIAYQYGSIPLAAIAMPDDRDVQDIDTLNNYLVLACPDGRFYWIVPGADVVDALDFATAESSPDGLIAARRLGEEIWLFGNGSTEIWQTTGDSLAPFQRAAGRTLDQGCLARDTVRRFDNSLLWVGTNPSPGVYRAAQIPQKISDSGIDQRLRERNGEPSAMVIGQDGHEIYMLKIPGQGSFGYDAATGQWHEATSEGEPEWKPHVSTITQSPQLLGDEGTGRIWKYDPDVNTDDGVVFTRLLTGNVALMGLPNKQDSFSIGVGASADTVARVRWKDGQEDFPDYYDELEVRAPYDIATMYRLGQPRQPVRSFEVSFNEDVKVRVSGAMTGGAWQ